MPTVDVGRYERLQFGCGFGGCESGLHQSVSQLAVDRIKPRSHLLINGRTQGFGLNKFSIMFFAVTAFFFAHLPVLIVRLFFEVGQTKRIRHPLSEWRPPAVADWHWAVACACVSDSKRRAFRGHVSHPRHPSVTGAGVAYQIWTTSRSMVTGLRDRIRTAASESMRVFDCPPRGIATVATAEDRGTRIFGGRVRSWVLVG